MHLYSSKVDRKIKCTGHPYAPHSYKSPLPTTDYKMRAIPLVILIATARVQDRLKLNESLEK